MVRPCVARDFFVDLVGDGLASMYPASRWSVAPGHHGYQRACDLISGQASTKPFGSPVFAYAGKTDPPSSSQILSQTSAGEKVATSSIALLLFEQFLCSRLTPFLLYVFPAVLRKACAPGGDGPLTGRSIPEPSRFAGSNHVPSAPLSTWDEHVPR